MQQLKYNEVRLAILDYVARSGLKVGDKLPPEREFLSTLQCSSGTIRSALQGLVEEGFIRKRHGIGSFLERDIAESKLQGRVLLLNLTRFPQYDHIPLEGLARIRRFLRERGLGVEYLETAEIDSDVIDLARNCLGILLYNWVSAGHVEVLRALRLPMYLIGNVPALPHIRQVKLDLQGAAYDLTAELIRRGAKRIGLVNAPDTVFYSSEIRAGFDAAMRRAKLPVRDEDVVRKNDAEFNRNLDEFIGRLGDYDAVAVECSNVFPFFASCWQLRPEHQPQIGVLRLSPEEVEANIFIYGNGLRRILLSVYDDSLYQTAAQQLAGNILNRQPLEDCVLHAHLVG